MEIPNARILDDGFLRFGYAQADPYRWYTVGMGIFPGLEFSGRYTELNNMPSNMPEYGDDKDKAFDLKYQLVPESKWIPAMAIGLHDFHGTQLFNTRYVVFSHRLNAFDFTFGVGKDRLDGIFGGIEWAVHQRITLLAEYNPIEYEKDKKPAVPEGAESSINAGIRINIYPGMDLGLSYQRGETEGFMFHIESELGKLSSHRRPDPPLWAPVDRRFFGERDKKEMVNKIHAAIKKAGFKEISVYTDGFDLTAEFENGKYLSDQKAAGRVLRILLFYSPEDTHYLHAILKRRKTQILKVSVKPKYMERYILYKIPEDTFPDLITVESIESDREKQQVNIARSKKDKAIDYQFGIKPDIETYLNDPSGAFKARLSIKPYVSPTFWKGGSAYIRYDIPFYSNIESSNIPPEDAVRSDSWKYSDTDLTFERLMFDQVVKLSKKSFFRLSFGCFEKMYAGVGGEFLIFMGKGNFAFGIEGDWVRKREPGTQLSLMDFESHTILGNAYYNFAGTDIIHRRKFDLTFHANYGRFLAGDKGWKFDISRHFDNGVVVGAWYSLTDTDDFTDFNEDYHDKGVFLSMPANILSRDATNRKYRYTISPWTRDVAQTVQHLNPLYDFASDLMPYKFEKGLTKIKE